ncbi:MAG: MFS transporter, partial [Candidatus Competibacterales bacterium]
MSRASSGPVPFARLASCYFFFFANVGIFLPYWSLYLQSLGLSPARIGELLAVAMATRLVAPYLWGWLVDVTGRPLAAVRGGCWVSLLAFAGVWGAEASPWALGAVLLCYSFFWNAILAPLEVVTLRHLKDQTQRYGAIRSWGSVGFVVFATGYGWLLPTLGPMGVPWAMALTIVALGIMGATVPTAPGEFVRGGGVGGTILKTVLARREGVALLLVRVVVEARHGPVFG